MSRLKIINFLVMTLFFVFGACLQSMERERSRGSDESEKTTRSEKNRSEINRRFLAAAIDGDVKGVSDALRAGADADARDEQDNNALHLIAVTATQLGHQIILSNLLARGAQPNAFNRDGHTPLHGAASKDNAKVIKLLLQRGADKKARTRTESGDTALHRAARDGRIKALIELLQNPADVNAENSKGQTPLDLVDAERYPDIVQILLDAGALSHSARQNLSATDKLMHAAMNGDLPALNRALELPEVDINASRAPNNYGPLHWAAAGGHLDVADRLIQRGASLGEQDRAGYTPLHRAVFRGHAPVVLQLLIRGSNPTIANGLGNTALHTASVTTDPTIARLLIDRYQDGEDRKRFVNARNNRGRTALHAAAQRGNLAVIRLLLASGAEIDHRDIEGQTALHLAVRAGHLEVVRELLNHRASINAQTRTGYTPLHIAAARTRVDIMQELVTRSADLTLANTEGYTALWIAAFVRNTAIAEEMVEYLIRGSANLAQRTRPNFANQVEYGFLQRLRKHPDREKIAALLNHAGRVAGQIVITPRTGNGHNKGLFSFLSNS
jgi:ankyrin repeat protein